MISKIPENNDSQFFKKSLVSSIGGNKHKLHSGLDKIFSQIVKLMDDLLAKESLLYISTIYSLL